MSQTEWIITQLKRGKIVTPIDALSGCGCFRLAARIDELRRLGNTINTIMLTNAVKRYAGYKLIKAKQ